MMSPVFANQLLQESLKEEAHSYRQKGYRLQTAGNLVEALSYYQKAVSILPTYKEVYNDLGVVYESLGRIKEALAMYKKSLKIDPNYLAPDTNLALLYEKQGNIKLATEYWIKRYRQGKKGEYWHEVARQHLLRLGTYPAVHREMLERSAANLSKKLVYAKEQQRLKSIEEARLHYEVGLSLFGKQNFPGALKELKIAQALRPQNKEFQMKVANLYVTIKKSYTKQRVKRYMNEAITQIDEDDYTSAVKNIEQALSLISSFSQ